LPRAAAALFVAAFLASCAQNSGPRGEAAKAPAANAGTSTPRAAAIPLPPQALVTAQPAPNCELESALGDVSAADAVRAKLDYQQQCYRQAEGLVRARLHALQSAVEATARAVKRRDGRS
jgi:PBP1b-binding outer membrane lipoprotein LpoB